MTLLGVTGGIGMGKSASADFLRARGIPVVDTDVLAREIVEPGEPALAEIQQAFGHDVVDARGELRRDELARRVFASQVAREQLEAILHPRIREIWRARVQTWCRESHTVAAVIIPLLYETHAEADFDAVICTACSSATQRQRLQARGWSAEQIVQRIQAQLPVEQKIAKADYIVWSEGPLNLHAAQLDRILAAVL